MRRDLLEDESNPDRWMVSYADFITLLFAFFVVMYAISSVNDEKYRILSKTLSEAFDTDAASPEPIAVGEPTLAASPHIVDIPDSTAFADFEEGDTFIEDPADAAQSLLGGFAGAQGVAVESNNDWLELSLDAEVLFDQGGASLSAAAKQLLQPAVELARSTRTPITVEGYTDNVPAASSRYPSNWELSSARASALARFLVEQGVRAERITAVGYGENHPVATNATPTGRASNRRVVMVLARRANGVRNLNADPGASAFAVVRASDPDTLDPSIVQVRTPDGGLRFSNEAPAATDSPENGLPAADD